MNRRQFFAVTLLPVAATAVGIKVYASVPHIALLADSGDVLARSDELPVALCRWLCRADQEGAYEATVKFKANREVTAAYYELRDLDAHPSVARRKSLAPPIWLRARDNLELTWQWKRERQALQ